MDGSEKNVLNLCRLCLQTGDSLVSVLDTGRNDLSEKIYSCFLVEILESDEISQKICLVCQEKVESFFSFKQTVVDCQEKLSQLLLDSRKISIDFQEIELQPRLEDLSDLSEVKCTSDWCRDGVDVILCDPIDGHPVLAADLDLPQNDEVDKVDNPLDLRCTNIFKDASDFQTNSTKKSSLAKSHSCNECVKSFSSLRPLLKHLKKCHEGYSFSCSKCKLSFKSAEELKLHGRSHKEKYVCEQCNYSSFSSGNFKLHMMKHNSEFVTICAECGKGFYKISNYEEHKAKKHSQDVVVHKCDKCGNSYHSRSYLLQHLKTHDPDFERKDFQCELCGKTFLTWKGVRRHLFSIHEGNRYKCDVCFKEVSSLDSLKVHKKIHTGEKSYICDECGKTFLRLSGLVVHRRVHSGEKPYSCDVCGKSFTQRSTLNVHLRVHTGEKPYPCHLCNKSFTTRTLLNSHLKTHQSSGSLIL